MRIAASLLLVLLIAYVAMALRVHAPGVDRAMIGLAVGMLMIGAWLSGLAFKAARLPKVSGYLVFGLLVGPSAWGLIPDAGVIGHWKQVLADGLPFIHHAPANGAATPTDRVTLDNLRFVKDLAIALIAITAGGEIRFDWLRGQVGRIAALSTASVVVVTLIVAAVVAPLHLTGVVDLIGVERTTAEAVVFLLLLSLIASGNSPSIAIAVINELRADGPLSRTTLAVTVCKDLIIIIVFATALSVSKGLLDPATGIGPAFMLGVAVQLGGSLLLGVVAGLLMGLIVSRMSQHLVFFIVGACFFFALLGEQDLHVAGQHVHLKPLLIALAAGITMRNAQPAASAPLFHAIEQMSLPIYCLFFAVAGAQLQLNMFTTAAGALAVGLVVAVRAASVWGVVGQTGRMLRLDDAWRSKLWLCLLPQSGVTLALATLVDDAFGDQPWGRALVNLLLGLVAIHALAGPIAYEWALRSAGEAGQADARPAA